MLTETSFNTSFSIRGPLGGPRPLAQPNPVSEEDIQQCVDSRAAEKYIEGLERRFGVEIPEERTEKLKRDWCSGILEFTSLEPTELDELEELPDEQRRKREKRYEEGTVLYLLRSLKEEYPGLFGEDGGDRGQDRGGIANGGDRGNEGRDDDDDVEWPDHLKLNDER